MIIAGITAEYNPFHLGHLYQISRIRETLGQDTCIAALMSGNFTQRGQAAIFDKHSRARAAVMAVGGADLVLELPIACALSSAEGFAAGAVDVFQRLGDVEYLSFGSESGNTRELMNVAQLLESSEFTKRLKEYLAGGASFAKARHLAVSVLDSGAASILEQPNNILAVEYLKALIKTRIKPLTIQRAGSGYHSLDFESELPSATAMRAMIAADDGRWKKKTPELPARVFQEEIDFGRGPVTQAGLDQAIVSRLRFLDEAKYEGLAHGGEGLGLRLLKAVRSEPTTSAIAEKTKTKRYAHSRIMRMICCAVLGIESGMLSAPSPYVRVLAFNDRGRLALRRFRENGEIPLITKYSELADNSDYFRIEAAASDLYVLGYPDVTQRRGGSEFLRTAEYIR